MQVWEKLREHNHFLDCRNYARAASAMLGLDRMTETDWQAREVRYGKEVPEGFEQPSMPTPHKVPVAPTGTVPRKKRPSKWFKKPR